MNAKETEILHTATQNLHRVTGAQARTVQEVLYKDRYGYDGSLELIFGKRKQAFLVEVKNELRASHVANIVKQKAKGEAFLLVCQYIPMPLKRELKDLHVNYLEAAGNCYINEGELFVFVNDQQVTPVRLPVEGKIWKAAGLKYLFAILRDPILLNRPYRQVAEAAGVALGNVGVYLEELRKEGFLKNGIINSTGGNRTEGIIIENKSRLIHRWAEAYQTNLRPKEWGNNFRFMNATHQKDWRNIKTEGFKWGGENAAALLTNYLHPEKFTLYISGNRLDLMKRLRLVPDSNGNVEMIEQFWPDDEDHRDAEAVVPPLLAYADLLAGNDSRNHEAAERIKARYLD